MKILLLGANGQVGWQLRRSLALLGAVKACDRHTADLTKPKVLTALIQSYQPAMIVNAAAYTAVDQAEGDAETAQRINADAVAVLAAEAMELDALLVHYSTDYVFDGRQTTPYCETDTPIPTSVYGQTKLAGEKAIRDSGCRHLIFRTCWVYAARGNNFARTMLRLARNHDQLTVVSDQHGTPTSAGLIADVTALCLYRIIIEGQNSTPFLGTYHLTASGQTTWHAFAQTVIAEALKHQVELRATPEGVQAITTRDYPTPATRPAHSLLDTNKLSETFGLCLPPWQDHVQRLIPEILKQDAL